jgi:dipeptidase D
MIGAVGRSKLGRVSEERAMVERSIDTGGDRVAWANGLEPAGVWQEFAALSAIPRRSKHEQAVRQHVVERLAEHRFTVRTDEAGNVVADIPASSGARSAAPVVLQAHLDMVCEAEGSAGTDPAVDGVFPSVADGWAVASGTTLGADDGIGVAIALALAAEAAGETVGRPELLRPPLQLLFTVDEEEDFTGAAGVDPRLISGRVLLNLDAEDENEVIIGSAGGSRVFVRVPAEWQDGPEGVAVELRVRGLEGGHSGQQIDDNLMNALKALGYALAFAGDLLGPDAFSRLAVADLHGGRADNAIPREAGAVLVVGPEERAALERVAADVQRRIRAWRSGADDEAVVEVVDRAGTPPTRVLSPRAARTAVDLLIAMPSGVLALDESLPDIVRTSTNLGIASVDDNDVVLVSAPRSSRPGDLDALHARYSSLGRLAGGQVTVTSEYPAWQPDFDSPLLDVVRAAYVEVHGRDPRVTAVHAGLEAGEIAFHLPGLVAVSIGPTIQGAHAPGERLDVASVARFYDLVRGILARLTGARPGGN